MSASKLPLSGMTAVKLVIGTTAVLICALAVYIKSVEAHASSWHFVATNWCFRGFTFVNRVLLATGVKSTDRSCSVELQTMDDIFRSVLKPDYTNHTLSTARKLLTQTRSGRRGFLKITLPPIWNTQSNQIELATINAKTQVLWLNKQRIANGLIVSLHGGAYISGDADSCLPYLVPLSERTRMAGLSVAYPLSPEVILPTQIDAVFEVYRYLLTDLAMDPRDIIFVGDSAGASLLILLFQKCVRDSVQLPLCGLTMSSWDVPSTGKSYFENRARDSLMDGATGQIWGHFAVGNLDINGAVMEKNEAQFAQRMSDNSEASYLHTDNLATFEHFPPMFLSASEWEVVLSDSTRIKQEMEKYSDASECVLFVTAQTGMHVLEDFYGHDIPEAVKLVHSEAAWILKQHDAAKQSSIVE